MRLAEEVDLETVAPLPLRIQKNTDQILTISEERAERDYIDWTEGPGLPRWLKAFEVLSTIEVDGNKWSEFWKDPEVKAEDTWDEQLKRMMLPMRDNFLDLSLIHI